MSLTQKQKDDLMAVIARTGGHREVALKQRVIPDSYKAYQEQCVRTEHTLSFPGLAPLRVIVTMPKKRGDHMPLHVNYHGGGFIFPQNEDDDMYCAHLAAACGCVVVDVDYAVCPDAVYPMAVDQSWEAAKWAYAHCGEWGCDENRFSIGGSSAGGNLAFTVALRNQREKALKICLLVQEYAANDLYQAVEDPAQERSAAFSHLYSDGDLAKLKTPMLSPVYASDEELAGMPETLFVAPKLCPFYEINNRLGMRMADQGVKVTFHAYPKGTHGFTIRMAGEDWLASQQDVIDAIRAAAL